MGAPGVRNSQAVFYALLNGTACVSGLSLWLYPSFLEPLSACCFFQMMGEMIWLLRTVAFLGAGYYLFRRDTLTCLSFFFLLVMSCIFFSLLPTFVEGGEMECRDLCGL
jgi:hypothetical protein